MIEDIQKLKVTVDELHQRVAKQEQKLLSLERELAEKTALEDVDKYQVVDSYKEPVLQRVDKGQLFSKNKNNSSFMHGIGWLLGIGVVASAGWLLYITVMHT
jgi:hypothetical protein